MLFNSYEFVFAFLPIVLLGFFLIGRRNNTLAALFLGGSSLLFYAWFNPESVPILLISIFFNYYLGLKISNNHSLLTLRFAIFCNLAVLGFFKYFNFFLYSITSIFLFPSNIDLPLIETTLPIGISFFTFTQIAFLVDCYQRKVFEKNWIHYLLFVTYFPHLIAGPVLHHAQMMPQFASHPYRLDRQKFAIGVVIFSIGISKKILIANPLGEYSDVFYNNLASSHPSSIEAWLAALAFTFQIYFDFSGYTDMAIGISNMFGINLPINFNAPLRSRNIIEFWRRWHISLSTFLKHYLYIPLGGNRNGRVMRYRNLFITMILGGLWHGASWNFVIWGAAHGALLSLNHLWQSYRPASITKYQSFSIFAWLLTFLLITLTFVIFRVETLSELKIVFYAMFSFSDTLSDPESIFSISNLLTKNLTNLLLAATLIVFLEVPSHRLKLLFQRFSKNSSSRSITIKIWALGSFSIWLIFFCINKVGEYNPFLYFQF